MTNEILKLLTDIVAEDPFYNDPEEGAFCTFCGVEGRRHPHKDDCAWKRAGALLIGLETLRIAPRKVYVVWLHDMTLGTYDSVEKAVARVDAYRAQFPGEWKQLNGRRWVREYVMGSGYGSISRLEWKEEPVL